jgi:hypothetical protein
VAPDLLPVRHSHRLVETVTLPSNISFPTMCRQLPVTRRVRCRVSISDAFDDSGGGHAVADAHDLEAELAVRRFETGEHLGHEARAGGS